MEPIDLDLMKEVDEVAEMTEEELEKYLNFVQEIIS